jgi:hypothetical protein
MFTINIDAVNTFINPNFIASITLDYYYKWRVDWYHRSGGDVQSWYIGSENCPITEIGFEENLKLMGAGDVKLAYIDFLIHSDDIVEVYYKNNIIWRGIVDGEPDPKGDDTIKLIPYSQRLDEIVINKSYTTTTIASMLSDIFDDISDITDIGYNEALIDLGDTNTYTIDFQYVTAKKAIDTLVDKLDDRYWGVDSGNNFNIYTLSSNITEIIAGGQDQWYSKIKRKFNYGKVKATRAQNFRKGSTSGQSEWVGQVGYDLAGGTYPTLPIEKLKRRIDIAFNVSEDNVSSGFVNDLSYAKLQKEAVLEDTVTIDDVRIDKVNPEIGDYLKVIDDYEKQLIPFKTSTGALITDSITNWSGGTLYTDDYVNGIGCIQMLGSSPTNSAIIYDFGEILRFKNIEKISFMALSEEQTGNQLEFSVAETIGTLWGTTYDIVFNASDRWEAKNIILAENSFRYMGIRMNYTREITRYNNTVNVNAWNEFGYPALSIIFRFGDFRWYGYGRQEYRGNIVKKDYKINNKGEQIKYTLNKYELQANDDFFALDRELQKIKDVQKT